MASCKTDFLCTLLVFEIEAKLLEHNTLFETRRNWFLCPIVFKCLIGKLFGWVGLSSITEPNWSQPNDWSSITEHSIS